ncbi:MAG: RsmE family RNA methyltransferase [Phycisphaerae bacterium]
MRRLYCQDFNIGRAKITGPEVHHGRDVLRLKPGDPVELFDGRGQSAQATVEQLLKSEIQLRINETQTSPLTKPRITLATAIPKFAHQETLVRMATELGISVFRPIIFARSSVREQFRSEKWRRWTIEACKQCGMNYLPELKEAIDFKDLIKMVGEYDLTIFGHTKSTMGNDLSERLKQSETILLVVGPEGGFTEDELLGLQNIGALPIQIGQNILRIETAAVALSTVITFLSSRWRQSP